MTKKNWPDYKEANNKRQSIIYANRKIKITQ